MVKVILKYPFGDSGEDVGHTRRTRIKVPMGANVIEIGRDPVGKMCVWVEVTPDAAKEFQESDFSEVLTFRTIATGSEFEAATLEHLATVRGGVVLHVYREVIG